MSGITSSVCATAVVRQLFELNEHVKRFLQVSNNPVFNCNASRCVRRFEEHIISTNRLNELKLFVQILKERKLKKKNGFFIQNV